MSAALPEHAWHAALAAAVTQPGLAVPDCLLTPPGGSTEARLAVYRNNALVPLVLALEESLPALARLLGAATLRAELIRFVRAHPPTSPVLLDYGQQLPEFLQQSRSAQRQPAAVDLARLELQLVRAWHAADAPLLGAADFARLLQAPDALAELRFAWHPAAVLLHSEFPVGTLWLAARPGYAGTMTAGDGVAPGCEAPAPRAQSVLVTRSDWSVQVRVLAPAEAQMLAVLHGSGTLGEALASGLGTAPAVDPATLLTVLVDGGFASAALAPPDQR
ncbi:MAG: putative DNA-binding domain-containing protein [Pseudomonadota bacterium]|nr:putative DNA-binding domain-containing protein [Pseudomonadota bacterium]